MKIIIKQNQFFIEYFLLNKHKQLNYHDVILKKINKVKFFKSYYL